MPRKARQSAVDDRVRVEHMVEAARDILSFVRGRARNDLESDAMLRRAVTNAIQQIGEAAAGTSDLGRLRVPGLPWGEIVAMRHILVHVYWGVDLNRVWATAITDIPLLLAALEHACEAWPMPSDPAGEGDSPSH